MVARIVRRLDQFSTATSGEGMSGLPNPRSMTSSPARRAASFNASISAKTYGGRPLIRRNSIGSGYRSLDEAFSGAMQLQRLDARRATSSKVSRSRCQLSTAQLAPESAAPRRASRLPASGHEGAGHPR